MALQSAPPAATPTPPGRTFILAIFLVGIVITVIVGYLGVTGALGGGIVGTHANGVAPPPPLTSCQGHGKAGTFYFAVVANAKGEGSFNATSPGPCFAVAAGSKVTMNFSVAVGSNRSDSWALIGPTGPVTQSPVFPGAGWTNSTATTGLREGQYHEFTFVAATAGSYRYVSQVGDHAAAGMWGPFNVTSGPLTSASTAGHPVAVLATPLTLRSVHA